MLRSYFPEPSTKEIFVRYLDKLVIYIQLISLFKLYSKYEMYTNILYY